MRNKARKAAIVTIIITIASIGCMVMLPQPAPVDPPCPCLEMNEGIAYVDGETCEDITSFLRWAVFYHYHNTPPANASLLANATTVADIEGCIETYAGRGDMYVHFVLSPPYGNRAFPIKVQAYRFYVMPDSLHAKLLGKGEAA